MRKRNVVSMIEKSIVKSHPHTIGPIRSLPKLHLLLHHISVIPLIVPRAHTIGRTGDRVRSPWKVTKKERNQSSLPPSGVHCSLRRRNTLEVTVQILKLHKLLNDWCLRYIKWKKSKSITRSRHRCTRHSHDSIQILSHGDSWLVTWWTLCICSISALPSASIIRSKCIYSMWPIELAMRCHYKWMTSKLKSEISLAAREKMRNEVDFSWI